MTATFGTEEYAANLALGHLGQPEIAQMADATTRARKIRQFFPAARRATLRLKPWNFATAWVTPAKDPVAGIGDLTNRFVMPADCLRVRFIKGDNRREWSIETGSAAVGGVDVEATILVTNIDDPTVCYTRDVTAVRLWDDLFLQGFALMLAGYTAQSLGRSRELSESLKAQAASAVAGAATIDAKESGGEKSRPEPSWAMARRGGGRTSWR